jgi:hypothetical protein
MAACITITSHMDSGNIQVVDASSPSDIALRLRPDPHCTVDNAAHYQWFNFSLHGCKGMDVSMRIVNAGGASYPLAWHGYHACASYDLKHWFRFPGTSYDEGTGVRAGCLAMGWPSTRRRSCWCWTKRAAAQRPELSCPPPPPILQASCTLPSHHCTTPCAWPTLRPTRWTSTTSWWRACRAAAPPRSWRCWGKRWTGGRSSCCASASRRPTSARWDPAQAPLPGLDRWGAVGACAAHHSQALPPGPARLGWPSATPLGGGGGDRGLGRASPGLELRPERAGRCRRCGSLRGSTLGRARWGAGGGGHCLRGGRGLP